MSTELTIDTLGPWYNKLTPQSDDTLAELAWPSFSVANPAAGLNATSKLSSQVNWLIKNLPVVVKRAGEEGEKFMAALSVLAYRAEQTTLDKTKPIFDFVEEALQSSVEGAKQIKEFVGDAEKATDIHLFLIVVGFIAGFLYPHVKEVPLGDIAAFGLLTLRQFPKIFRR